MNNKNNILDLSKFDKIEDIIFYDEPILTHLKKNEENYLMYLVDTVEDTDIYLIYKIQESELYSYLTSNISLYELFSKNSNPIFKIKQNFNGEVIESNVVFIENIDEKYLPISNSFLEFKPSEKSYYKKFIENYNNNIYLEKLRNEAFYVKFSSNSAMYGDTIGLIELSNDFLTKISSSFKSFIKADFNVNFREKITDKVALRKTISAIQEYLDYRIVDLNFGSFEMGLAVDTVMKKSIEDKEVNKWATNIGFKFKNIVLDNNFDSEELDAISNSYSKKERREIFKPIYDISNNPNYRLQIKDRKTEKYSNIKFKSSKEREILIPNIPVEENKISKDLQIVQITTVLDKNKNTKTVKVIEDLFSTKQDVEYIIDNTRFEKNGLYLDKDISFKVHIKTESGLIHVSTRIGEIGIHKIYDTDNLDDILNNFTKIIHSRVII
ncbi:hypothetical protein [Aurantibacter aestuarii]|uniref:Uncharacterized protein n=1 Tax=Aurantibacter aestuarii TaxID=1266046 RepID=A0A2T1NEN6_9FLAO|nr:hypothetical protein [Aurantibacter aestuarii]PSG90894.1 hypothetical protein C7H52_06370 [Aurantibacter aestuarii]